MSINLAISILWQNIVIIVHISTTINFTRLSVTMEVRALYGHLICGWLVVVWGWLTHAMVSSACGGWAWSLHGKQT